MRFVRFGHGFWRAWCAVAAARRELPSVQLAALPRMADFARFGECWAAGWAGGRGRFCRRTKKTGGRRWRARWETHCWRRRFSRLSSGARGHRLDRVCHRHACRPEPGDACAECWRRRNGRRRPRHWGRNSAGCAAATGTWGVCDLSENEADAIDYCDHETRPTSASVREGKHRTWVAASGCRRRRQPCAAAYRLG